MKDREKNTDNYPRGSLFIRIFMLVLAFCVAATSIFSWFSHKPYNTAGGMNLTVDSNKLVFMDRVEVTRRLGDVVTAHSYKRDSLNGNYYQCDSTGNYILDETSARIPINFTGMLPTEYVEIQVWYRAIDVEVGENFSYYIGTREISCTKTSENQWERDGFFIIPGENDETPGDGVNETRYSALGVFRFSWSFGTANGSEFTFDEDLEWESEWLCDYGGGVYTNARSAIYFYKPDSDGDNSVAWNQSDTLPVEGATDKYYDGNGEAPEYATIKFRLNFDLEQYNTAGINRSNLLSEFIVNVGRLFLTEK